jgi:hypothetical protein
MGQGGPNVVSSNIPAPGADEPSVTAVLDVIDQVVMASGRWRSCC